MGETGILVKTNARRSCYLELNLTLILGEYAGFFIVGNTGVEQLGVLGADGNWQVLPDGVKVDVIPKNVPLNRLQECLPAAFQTFE
jgi:hypothetical protein